MYSLSVQTFTADKPRQHRNEILKYAAKATKEKNKMKIPTQWIGKEFWDLKGIKVIEKKIILQKLLIV